MTAARGIRNRNPGNIEKGQPWKGLAEEQTDPRFAVFESMAWGIRALIILLQTYFRKHRLRTVRGIITRWAPPTDDNDTEAYIAAVCAPAGIGPDDELSDNRFTFHYLAREIARHENGPAGFEQITSDDWTEGLRLAYEDEDKQALSPKAEWPFA